MFSFTIFLLKCIEGRGTRLQAESQLSLQVFHLHHLLFLEYIFTVFKYFSFIRVSNGLKNRRKRISSTSKQGYLQLVFNINKRILFVQQETKVEQDQSALEADDIQTVRLFYTHKRCLQKLRELLTVRRRLHLKTAALHSSLRPRHDVTLPLPTHHTLN